jgi:hypothetical protein
MSAEPLDQETIDALDKLFNAWLVIHGMLSKGGTLYQTDKTGKILADAKGTLRTVDAQQFKSLMANPEQGFQSYVAAKGINLTTIQRDYPE